MKDYQHFFWAGAIVLFALFGSAKNLEKTPYKPRVVFATTDTSQVIFYLEEGRIAVLDLTGGVDRFENAILQNVGNGWEAQTASGSWHISNEGQLSFEKE